MSDWNETTLINNIRFGLDEFGQWWIIDDNEVSLQSTTPEFMEKQREIERKKKSEERTTFLSYDNPALVPETQATLLACTNCANKTYLIVQDDPRKFRLMVCSCCRTTIGRFGWEDG